MDGFPTLGIPDTGDTAWMLASSALVLLMTPGLAFFYGGLNRSKSVLNMMMMSFITMGTVGTVWVLWGYSQTFGPDVAGGGRGMSKEETASGWIPDPRYTGHR